MNNTRDGKLLPQFSIFIVYFMLYNLSQLRALSNSYSERVILILPITGTYCIITERLSPQQ